MNVLDAILALAQAAIVFGTVILYGAVGEVLTEKSGNLNLGVPGIMYLGGIAGLIGAFLYESVAANPAPVICLFIALGCAFAAAVLGALIFGVLTISLRANQNVAGLTLTIFSAGIANFFGGMLNTWAGGVGQISVAATSAVFRANIPFLRDIPVVGKLLFSHGFMVYLALILAFAVSWFLKRTGVGLNLRAVGENPATADAAGIPVTKYKYLATMIGGGISGLGGLYYVMDYIKGTWANDGKVEQLGWLAVALVIFASWRTTRAIWGAFLFGLLFWLYLYIPGLSRSAQELLKMLPFATTIGVLIVVSLRRRRENQPPASLGLSYFREER